MHGHCLQIRQTKIKPPSPSMISHHPYIHCTPVRGWSVSHGSGSIPKVNKLTHGIEWIVNRLLASRGQSEWSILFGQLSRGEMSGLHQFSQKGQTDGQTASRRNQINWQIGKRGTWHCWGGRQCSVVTLKLPFDWNNDLQCTVVGSSDGCPLQRHWHTEEVMIGVFR